MRITRGWREVCWAAILALAAAGTLARSGETVEKPAAPPWPPPPPAAAAAKDAPAEGLYFRSDVIPLVTRLGCNQTACHGAASGKGGFKLSMFGGDPEDDYAAMTKAARGRRVNRVEPAKSLLLLKPTAGVPHGRQQRVAPGSAEFKLLSDWLVQAAPWGDDKEPVVTSIKVAPGGARF